MQNSDMLENTPPSAPTRPVCGCGIVILREGEDGGLQVAMIRRGKPPWQGTWSIPGGTQELGETIQACAIREAAEETGLAVSLGPVLDVVNHIAQDEAGRVTAHHTLVEFLAMVHGGTLQAGSDAMEAAWIPLDEAATLPVWKETQRLLHHAAAVAPAWIKDQKPLS